MCRYFLDEQTLADLTAGTATNSRNAAETVAKPRMEMIINRFIRREEFLAIIRGSAGHSDGRVRGSKTALTNESEYVQREKQAEAASTAASACLLKGVFRANSEQH